MASRRKNETLVEQAVSKLLDAKGSKVSRSIPLLEYPQPIKAKPASEVSGNIGTVLRAPFKCDSRRKKNKSTKKKPSKTIPGAIFVGMAWILLVFNMLLVMGYLDYGWKNHLNLDTIEGVISLPIQVTMVVAGAITLGLTSWLYWRDRSIGGIKVPAIIIIILLVSLTFLSKEPGDEWGFGRILSQCFLADTAAPQYRPVTGILYNKDKPSALFDYDIIHEGDTINGINVVRIHRDKVEFEYDGKRWSQAVEAASQ